MTCTSQDHRIKIVDVIHVDADVLLKDRVVAMNKKCYKNSVICNQGKQTEILQEEGVLAKSINIPRKVRPFKLSKAFVKLFMYLRKGDFDIVHTHSTIPGLLGRIAGRLAGVPIIIHTVHGFPFHEHMHPLQYRFYLSLEKIGARFCDALLFQNQRDLKLAENYQFNKFATLQYIGNGINIQRFLSPFDSGSNNRSSESRCIITCIARFEEVKNHKMLLQAISILKEQKEEELELWLVGDGPLRDRYETFCKDHEITPYVKFLGYRKDIPNILRKTDIAVLTSTKEGIPRGLLEPMIMSVPVVATNVKGNNEVVIDGQNGYLVPLQDYESLAQRLLELIRNPALRREMGVRGMMRVREEFDEKKVIERLDLFYRELLETKER